MEILPERSAADDRIPVRLAQPGAAGAVNGAAGPGALMVFDARVAGSAPAGATVVEFGALAASAHAVGCACCAGRPAFGTALGALFAARARGEVAFFVAVLAISDAAGRAAARAALASDPLLRARYRLEPDGEAAAG